jgi:uncharacterized DUF497 family protein
MLRFEWDAPKSTANLRKHGVSFEEAAIVFGDPLALTFADPDHSSSRSTLHHHRSVASGSVALVVAHVERGQKVRIISARRATRQERTIYEQD